VYILPGFAVCTDKLTIMLLLKGIFESDVNIKEDHAIAVWVVESVLKVVWRSISTMKNYSPETSRG
jgi:hypothetical protein